jgi:hypothetical protein
VSLEQHVHDFGRVGHELFSTDSHTDQRDTLDRLATQQLQFVFVRVLNDVFQTGHQPVVVGDKLVLCSIGNARDSSHDLFEHEFRSFLHQLLKFGRQDTFQLRHEIVQVGRQDVFGAVFGEIDQSGTCQSLQFRVGTTLDIHIEKKIESMMTNRRALALAGCNCRPEA